MSMYPIGKENFYMPPGQPLVYRDKEPVNLDDPNLELDDLVPDPYDTRFTLTSPYHTVHYLGRTEPSEAPVDFVYIAGNLDSLQIPDGYGMWSDHEKVRRHGMSWHQATQEVRAMGRHERQVGYHTELAQKLRPEAGRLSIILAYGNPNAGMADLYYYMTK